MAHIESGRAGAEMLEAARAFFAEPDRAVPATQGATDFIAKSGGHAVATIDGPCMRVPEEKASPSVDASDLFAHTIPLDSGITTFSSFGKIEGEYGSASRGCAKLGCSRVCSVVIENDGTIVETNVSSFNDDCIYK